MMDGLSLDQIEVFLAVVRHGGFSAAARALRCGQTVITYQIQKLELQVGKPVFDRSKYRPELTEAGRALVPHARRIADAAGDFKLHAQAIAGGLEAELTMAVSTPFPVQTLLKALKAFGQQYPSVSPRIYMENVRGASQLVMSGVCTLGIMAASSANIPELRRVPLFDVDFILVASPEHPLARVKGSVSPEILREHIQLVVTDRSGVSGNLERGIDGTQTWSVADLGVKHAMLRASLGWGAIPFHMVEEDLRNRRLVRIVPKEWNGAKRISPMSLCVAYRSDNSLGPSTQWMLKYLAALKSVVV